MRRLLEQHGIDNLSQENVDEFFETDFFKFYDACMQGMNKKNETVTISLEDIIAGLKQNESPNKIYEELGQIFEEYRDQYNLRKPSYSMIGMDIDVTAISPIPKDADGLGIVGTLRYGTKSQMFVVDIYNHSIGISRIRDGYDIDDEPYIYETTFENHEPSDIVSTIREKMLDVFRKENSINSDFEIPELERDQPTELKLYFMMVPDMKTEFEVVRSNLYYAWMYFYNSAHVVCDKDKDIALKVAEFKFLEDNKTAEDRRFERDISTISIAVKRTITDRDPLENETLLDVFNRELLNNETLLDEFDDRYDIPYFIRARLIKHLSERYNKDILRTDQGQQKWADRLYIDHATVDRVLTEIGLFRQSEEAYRDIMNEIKQATTSETIVDIANRVKNHQNERYWRYKIDNAYFENLNIRGFNAYPSQQERTEREYDSEKLSKEDELPLNPDGNIDLDQDGTLKYKLEYLNNQYDEFITRMSTVVDEIKYFINGSDDFQTLAQQEVEGLNDDDILLRQKYLNLERELSILAKSYNTRSNSEKFKEIAERAKQTLDLLPNPQNETLQERLDTIIKQHKRQFKRKKKYIRERRTRRKLSRMFQVALRF